MLFPAMFWVITTGLGSALRAKADKLAHSRAHYTALPMSRLHGLVEDLSQSDGPWGEPPLTAESSPLRRNMSPENYSSIQSIKQLDEILVRALWHRLSADPVAADPDKAAVFVEARGDAWTEKPSPLRPVVFTLRQSHGGRTVRPESVVELDDKDSAMADGPGSPSMVVPDNCLWRRMTTEV